MPWCACVCGPMWCLCAAQLDLRRLFCSESQEVIFNNCYTACSGSHESYSTTVTVLSLKRSLQLSPHLRSSLKLVAPVVWTTTGMKVRATSCPEQLLFEKTAQLVVLDKYFLEKPCSHCAVLAGHSRLYKALGIEVMVDSLIRKCRRTSEFIL